MTHTPFKQGTPVQLGDHRGVIVRQYDGNIYEVRLPGGVGCYEVQTTNIIQNDAFWYRECHRLQHERDEWERLYRNEVGWRQALTD